MRALAEASHVAPKPKVLSFRSVACPAACQGNAEELRKTMGLSQSNMILPAPAMVSCSSTFPEGISFPQGSFKDSRGWFNSLQECAVDVSAGQRRGTRQLFGMEDLLNQTQKPQSKRPPSIKLSEAR